MAELLSDFPIARLAEKISSDQKTKALVVSQTLQHTVLFPLLHPLLPMARSLVCWKVNIRPIGASVINISMVQSLRPSILFQSCLQLIKTLFSIHTDRYFRVVTAQKMLMNCASLLFHSYQ